MKQKLTLLLIAIMYFTLPKLQAQYRMGYEFGFAKPLNDISDQLTTNGGYTIMLSYIYEDFEAGDLIINGGYDGLSFKVDEYDSGENTGNLGFFKFGGGFAYNLIEPEDYVLQAKALYNYSYETHYEKGIHDLAFGVSGGLDRIRLNLMFHLPLNSLEWQAYDHYDDVNNVTIYNDYSYKPTYITLSLMYVSGF